MQRGHFSLSQDVDPSMAAFAPLGSHSSISDSQFAIIVLAQSSREISCGD